jgi:hypothetical protein
MDTGELCVQRQAEGLLPTALGYERAVSLLAQHEQAPPTTRTGTEGACGEQARNEGERRK